MSSVEEKIDLPTLIKTMGKFKKKWTSFHRDKVNKPDLAKEERLKKQLDKISIRIRSLLPKDPDLSEIDDLFIPSTNQETLSETCYGDSMTFLYKRSLKFYDRITDEIKVTTKRVSLDPVNISTFIDVILFYLRPEIRTRKTCEICRLPNHLHYLEWKLADAWLGLKMLRVICIKYKTYSCQRCFGVLRDRIPWLMKLKDIPQSKSKEKQRLTSWISRQAAAILESLDCSFIYNDKHNFSLWTEDYQSYVCNLIHHNKPGVKVIDYLHTYFMSSCDEVQRVQLIESFIRGCQKAYETEISNPLMKLYDCDCTDLPEKILFLKYFGILTAEFHRYMWGILDPERFPEDQWNEIEKYYGNKFEPYLAENRCNSSIVHELSCQRINEKAKNTLDSENNGEPPEDLAIEKYIFFDGLINRLRVLSILREVLWKTAAVLEMDQFPENYETKIFRSFAHKRLQSNVFDVFVGRGLLVNFLHFGSRIYVATRMCPFLFLSKHHEYLMEDLLNILHEKVVDETIFEELYFAINCITSWEKSDYFEF